MEITSTANPSDLTRIGLTDRLSRSTIDRLLANLRGGELTISDGEREVTYGSGALTARIVVRRPRFYRRVLLGGGLGAAEALIEGDWECDSLTNFVRIMVRNLAVADNMDRRWGWLRWMTARAAHAWRKNTLAGARANIAEHYDLSNDFYQLWLDETMSYSAAVFPSPDASLAEASRAKLEIICQSLQLKPDDHLLEIGTGWGGLAIHAAQNYGCRVTTTTISHQQYEYATERVRKAGLQDRITVLNQDYRQLTGQFDKLVSIEMIEAVGHEYFGTFFQRCGNLLHPRGLMFLQSIVIADERYSQHLRSVDFIRKYIFPGGCLPSISVLTQTAAQAGGLRLVQMHDIAPHYAETLRRWRQAFHERIKDVRALGFDEAFIRMWNYYLCYCEAVFEERQVNNVQMLLAKRGHDFDPISSGRTPKFFSPQEARA